ncbi:MULTISPECIES: hypothetical protein [Klebsiella pneumoniae complex]|uniref:hypothetical protein n=1 Tax=Klebsiella pneumoniae complex TaxID=3390273 RepID=UPI0010F8FDE8|nr:MULTISPECIES: hypothetical protein [Klebsiella]MCI8018468.1 hypothetical protein [Klebsiella pneumoniae]HCB2065793.1 hypothetical protein [Klebsiella pneumoniae]
MWKKIISVFVIIFLAFSIFVYTSISFFAVQPIGAIPEGATFVMWKKGKMSTFESPDGLCIKATGGVSLMCRSMMLGTFMDKDAVLFKMPYIKSIYLKSTGDKEFDR